MPSETNEPLSDCDDEPTDWQAFAKEERSYFDRLADTFADAGPLDGTPLAAIIEATVPQANREARARDFHDALRDRLRTRHAE
jgi:hypothetical protein